jgi:hypothetical protein
MKFNTNLEQTCNAIGKYYDKRKIQVPKYKVSDFIYSMILSSISKD